MRWQASCCRSFAKWEAVASTIHEQTSEGEVSALVRYFAGKEQTLALIVVTRSPSRVVHLDFSASKRCMHILGKKRNADKIPLLTWKNPIIAVKQTLLNPGVVSLFCWAPQTYKKPGDQLPRNGLLPCLETIDDVALVQSC